MSRAVLTLVKQEVSSLEEAHEIVARLTSAGFARNSIRIERDGDDLRVEVHCRKENRARVQRVAAGSFAIGSPMIVAALCVGALAIGAGVFVALAAKRASRT
jgi:hypothetical protein